MGGTPGAGGEPGMGGTPGAGGEPGMGGMGGTPGAVEQAVTAAEGGTVEAGDGTAALDIPAGALPADTTITVAVEPAGQDTQTPIYDFGPDGLQFEMPVTLCIDFAGEAPEGMEAAVAWQDGDRWVALDDLTTEGGQVCGKTDHFTRFSVVWVEGGGAVIASECRDVLDTFAACGGDVAGAWNWTDICVAIFLEGGDNPIAEACPEATFGGELIIDASATFDADLVTYEERSRTTRQSLHVPFACFDANDLPRDCAQLAGVFDDGMCVEEGDGCTCSREEVEATERTSMSGYRIEGNELVFFSSEGGDEERAAYCVDGGTLQIEFVDDEDPANRQIQVFSRP
ncbi:MAG: hypothetical protein H6704_13695 [Myxococcales bacterium]|nr:hypothetical protein [Myxococcales bacterium]